MNLMQKLSPDELAELEANYQPPIPKITDSIVDAVRNDLKQRSEVGIKKYGVTLDRTDLSTKEWLQHLYEETLDSALYIKKLLSYEK